MSIIGAIVTGATAAASAAARSAGGGKRRQAMQQSQDLYDDRADTAYGDLAGQYGENYDRLQQQFYDQSMNQSMQVARSGGSAASQAAAQRASQLAAPSMAQQAGMAAHQGALGYAGMANQYRNQQSAEDEMLYNQQTGQKMGQMEDQRGAIAGAGRTLSYGASQMLSDERTKSFNRQVGHTMGFPGGSVMSDERAKEAAYAQGVAAGKDEQVRLSNQTRPGQPAQQPQQPYTTQKTVFGGSPAPQPSGGVYQDQTGEFRQDTKWGRDRLPRNVSNQLLSDYVNSGANQIDMSGQHARIAEQAQQAHQQREDYKTALMDDELNRVQGLKNRRKAAEDIELQTMETGLGIGPGTNPELLAEFQRWHGLKDDGVYGPRTEAMLKSLGQKVSPNSPVGKKLAATGGGGGGAVKPAAKPAESKSITGAPKVPMVYNEETIASQQPATLAEMADPANQPEWNQQQAAATPTGGPDLSGLSNAAFGGGTPAEDARRQIQEEGKVKIFGNPINWGALTGPSFRSGGFVDSDERKKNTEGEYPASAIFEQTPSYAYQYKPEFQGDPGAAQGPQVGIMAQDLERTPEGAGMVEEGPDGMKRVDTDRVAMAGAGAISEILERLKRLEGGRG